MSDLDRAREALEKAAVETDAAWDRYLRCAVNDFESARRGWRCAVEHLTIVAFAYARAKREKDRA